jgi:hypothetical protein
MGPRLLPSYAFRIEDLRRWHLVEATCFVCRHHAVLIHETLRRGREGHRRLIDLEPKLRCTRCNARGSNILSVKLMSRE